MPQDTLRDYPHFDHVGSLIRPPDLVAAWRAWEDGRIAANELAARQDDAIRQVVKLQEGLGLQLVSDGEFRRVGWSRGFINAVEGMEFRPGYLEFRNAAGETFQAPAPVATKKLNRTKAIVTDDFRFLKSIAAVPPKVTMPSPSHMHFGHFGEAADRTLYPDMEAYWTDLAAIYRAEITELSRIGCTHVQFDECPLALIYDTHNMAVMRQHGEDPDRLLDTYLRATNRALENRPRTMTIAMHMCRGNANDWWLGSAGYDKVAERVFNELDIDVFLLEYDTARAGDFTPLRFLPKGKRALLGLISTKSAGLEQPDHIKRRVDDAARFVPIEQLGLCPQCGFASAAVSKFAHGTNPMTLEIERSKLSLMVDIARDLWR